MPLGNVIRLVLLLILLGSSTSALAVQPHPEQNLYNRDFKQVTSGAREFDPISGKFLSFDPIWNAGDPEGYTFCAAGDPINDFDPDGRAPYAFNPYDPSTWIIPKNGIWSGAMGNSLWYPPASSDIFKVTGGQPIEYVSGTPNFRPFAQSIEVNGIRLPSTIKIEYSGDAAADRALAVRTLANQSGLTQNEINAALRANGIRIHHFYEGEMQLVPRGLNSEIPHGGLASALRAGNIDAGGVLLRGGGMALKTVSIIGVLTDPASVIAGPTTTFGDATLSGQYFRAHNMVDYPESFDMTDVIWAHNFLNTGFQVGAMNDPANIRFYINTLAANAIQSGNVNASPSSVSGRAEVNVIGKKP